MSDQALNDAQQAREHVLLEDFIDQRLSTLLSADTVSYQARAQLGKLLAHYAKAPHPFSACMRDNMKRFGPGRTEKVCATLKDIIRGTTRWRNTDSLAMSDAAAPEMTEEIETILLSISDTQLEELVQEASEVA